MSNSRPDATVIVSLSAGERRRLRRLNGLMAAIHGVEALLMIVLSNSRSLPVTGVFANGQPGHPNQPLPGPTFRTSFTASSSHCSYSSTALPSHSCCSTELADVGATTSTANACTSSSA